MPENSTDSRSAPYHSLHFDEPPINEVAIGVQFEPLARFSIAHVGAYWSRIRERYPYVEDVPPLPHQKELPDAKPQVRVESVIQFPMAVRNWFITEEKCQLIQLQRDQFYLNWRRFSGNETYPRFHVLIERFKQEWQEFRAHLQEQELGATKVDQCELTYVNHIPKGAGWETFGDLSKVFTFLGSPTAQARADDPPFLTNPEVVSWVGRYKLPDGRGRLHVEMNPAFRGSDFKVIAALTLKVRGEPAGNDPDGIFKWFEMAHEWAVRAFVELTDPAMHLAWKKCP